LAALRPAGVLLELTGGLARPSFPFAPFHQRWRCDDTRTHIRRRAASPGCPRLFHNEALGCGAVAHTSWLTRLVCPLRSPGNRQGVAPGRFSARCARHGVWFSQPMARRWLRAGMRLARSRTHARVLELGRTAHPTGSRACGTEWPKHRGAFSRDVPARSCTGRSPEHTDICSSPDDGELQGYGRARSFTLS
jgi:hypothetical protein